MSRRTATTRVEATGPLTLADLRWLVSETLDCDESSRVEVQQSRAFTPLDADPERIIVHGIPATEREGAR